MAQRKSNRAGRPRRVDADLAVQIDELVASGLRTRLGLTRALQARGHTISRRTVGRYLDEQHPNLGTAPRADELDDPAPNWRPPGPDPALEQAAAEALQSDDLTLIARAAEIARRLEVSWGSRADYDPLAARTFATVSKHHADLRERLCALRPREDVEQDRLTSLGEPARAALIARARAVVLQDFAGKYHRARQVLIAKGWL